MTLEAVNLLLRGVVLPDQNLASACASVKVSVVQVDQHVSDGVLWAGQILQAKDQLASLGSR